MWRGYAENVAETLKKGTQVIAQGRLKSRSYETKEGERRTSFELEVEEIGPTLRFATAQVTRAQRSAGGNFGGGVQGGFGGGAGYNAPAQGGYSAPQQNNFAAPQGNGYSGPTGYSAPVAPAAPAAPAADPWSSQSGGNYDWGSGADDEPPF